MNHKILKLANNKFQFPLHKSAAIFFMLCYTLAYTQLFALNNSAQNIFSNDIKTEYTCRFSGNYSRIVVTCGLSCCNVFLTIEANWAEYSRNYD